MKERGHAAIELAMGVAVLMLPVVLAVLAFGPWSERRVLAEAAAAESARAVVLDLDHRAGASVVASMASGLAPGQVRLGWCGSTPGPLAEPGGACSLTRGSVIVATVQIWTPLVSTPWGAIGGIWITADHAEPVDLYRSLP